MFLSIFILSLLCAAGALVGAAFAFPRNDPDARLKAVWAVLLFVPPIFALLWGNYFAVNPRGGQRNPPWVEGALDISFWVAVGLPVLLAATMTGARRFLVLVGAVCFVLEYWLCVDAAMQVTGIYP